MQRGRLVALCGAALLTGAKAQWRVVNTTGIFPSPSEGSGPFDLFHVYPFYSSNQLLETKDYAFNPNE
jgi:hypothetical protein